MSCHNDILLLEERLQKKFVLSQTPAREEIKDIESKKLKSIGYLLIVLFFPIWLVMWLLDNFVLYISCIKDGAKFRFLSFTSYSTATPYKQVDIIDKRIKLDINPKEHAPPHFHVIIDKKKYSFRIDDCIQINGKKMKPRDRKKLLVWYSINKELLINTWNGTRVTDCQVGEYKYNK